MVDVKLFLPHYLISYQHDQHVVQELQTAAVESLCRVGEAIAEGAKSRWKGEEWKMILPSLKQLNF